MHASYYFSISWGALLTNVFNYSINIVDGASNEGLEDIRDVPDVVPLQGIDEGMICTKLFVVFS